MTKKTYEAFGTWTSSISAADVAENAPKLSEPSLHDGWLYWLQSIADEQGRMGLFCRKGRITNDSKQSKPSTTPLTTSLTPSPFNIRSKVHEYGGKSYCIAQQTLYFVNATDQQIYSAKINYPDTHQSAEDFDLETPTLSVPKILTQTLSTRYAELSFNAQHKLLICIGETHFPDSIDHSEPKNFIAGIQISENTKNRSILVLAHGQDFYAYPKVSPNGKYLSYISWNHPNLPWDTTSLHILDLSNIEKYTQAESITGDFAYTELDNKEVSVNEGSILQPSWSHRNDLFYVSDCDDWWNIYSIDAENINKLDNNPVPSTQVTHIKAEFATPLWTLGMSTYAFLDDQTLIATYTQNGIGSLSLIDIPTHAIRKFESQASVFRDLVSEVTQNSAQAGFIVSSPTQNEQIISISKNELCRMLNNSEQRCAPLDNYIVPDLNAQNLNPDNISIGESFTFTSNEREVHAFLYSPKNESYTGVSSKDKPPVIVICHGGPTGQTTNALNLKIQFWTNRGFAVIDVNYTGSTGYGRKFRHSLYGSWGVYDVEDLVNAVEHASKKGWINENQKIIKGSSAGGYSVLASLAFTTAFDAGVCLYGIGDLELLAKDTHKFEARYLDQLIGPYPEEQQLYKERSPIHSTESLNCPLLIFQGLEDKVVPPNQAYAMADALRKKNLPIALVEYSDEGHGFRNPKNIQHMMESELFFYQKVFSLGSHLSGKQELNSIGSDAPITIENI